MTMHAPVSPLPLPLPAPLLHRLLLLSALRARCLGFSLLLAILLGDDAAAAAVLAIR